MGWCSSPGLNTVRLHSIVILISATQTLSDRSYVLSTTHHLSTHSSKYFTVYSSKIWLQMSAYQHGIIEQLLMLYRWKFEQVTCLDLTVATNITVHCSKIQTCKHDHIIMRSPWNWWRFGLAITPLLTTTNSLADTVHSKHLLTYLLTLLL